MLIRIKEMKILPDYMLDITFDDNRRVCYDVKEDMEEIPSYGDLRRIHGLFNQARVDATRTCIVWNKDIDLPSDILYAYGKPTR